MGKNIDYLIVGQGLAGSALAHQLIQKDKKIMIIDNNHPGSSSKIAAGLYNPITGRKMIKTWQADSLFPYLIDFYQSIERTTSSKFLYDKEIYRPFASIEEQNEWMAKSIQKEYKDYVSKVFVNSTARYLYDSYGGMTLNYTGYLDIKAYLQSSRQFFKERGLLIESNFEEDDLLVKEQVSYNGITARMILFCNGLDVLDSKYWQWLPFKPVKGEIIEIKSKMPEKRILNKGIFVIPIGNEHFRLGSTYDNNDRTTAITPEARLQIEEKMGKLVNEQFQVVKQVAGIRPATKDRRPLIGIHPEIETIAVFNGLGTKGVSLAPY